MKKEGTTDSKYKNMEFYKPKTINQVKYIECLNDDKTRIIFAVGPAGTGKTALACNVAIKEYGLGNYNKIIITRPVVPVEEEIGFLPGTMNKKMDPWIRPIFDVFLEFYSQKEVDDMIYNNIIEIAPLGFMRGRTFKNAFIIGDEMQNSSPNQMMMMTTRIGEGSKMVITGDLKQTDKSEQESGLNHIINKFKIYKEIEEKKYNNTEINYGIKLVEFENSDIMRDPIIKKLLDIYEVDNKSLYKNVNSDSALIPKNLYKVGWDML
jgi:phosphate starvation-inducible PhoH-like protein